MTQKTLKGAWAKSMYARGKKQKQNIHKINFTENLNNFNEITQHIAIIHTTRILQKRPPVTDYLGTISLNPSYG